MTEDLTTAARRYLELGFHLLALNGKRPNAEYHAEWDWENSIHGVPEGPEEEAALSAVFTHPRTTGIAILVPQHVLVADIDSEKAAAIFTELVPEWEPTVAAKTSKGLHVWYLAPGAEASVWIGGRDGLLMKGWGGYVVVEPSWHPGDEKAGVEPGHHYQWINPPWDPGIDFLPEPIAEKLRTQAIFDERKQAEKADSDFWTIEVEWKPEGGWRLWRRVSLDGLCKAIINAPDGNQNNVIAWAALVAQEEGVPYSQAMDVLLAAAIEGGHPERRARDTIKGVFTRRGRGR